MVFLLDNLTNRERVELKLIKQKAARDAIEQDEKLDTKVTLMLHHSETMKLRPREFARH